MNASGIFLDVIFGLIGIGYCVSGKRRGAPKLWICGLALGFFPYLVDNPVLILLIGILLCAAPFFIARD